MDYLLLSSDECINFYNKKAKKFKKLLGYKHIGECLPLIWSFIEYIYETENKELVFKGYDTIKSQIVYTRCPYLHRWSEGYVKKFLHRLYKLDELNIKNVTMITMTTYQDSDYAYKMTGRRFSIVESFELLIESRSKLIDVMRKMYTDLNYIWILENHDSGYAHCHFLYFGVMTYSDKQKLKKLWAEKYQAGSLYRGLQIESVSDVRRIRNYIMKYIKKSVVSLDLKRGMVDIRLLCYHAVAKDNGFRFYGCSKGISKVMNAGYDQKDNNVIWFEVGVNVSDYRWESGHTEYHECTISQENYELALEKLEEAKLLSRVLGTF